MRNEFNKLKKEQDRVKSKERYIDKEQKVQQRFDALENKGKDLDKERVLWSCRKNQQHVGREAQEALKEQLLTDAKSIAATQVQDILDDAKQKANYEAKIVIQTIQRVATEHSVENSVSVFNIKNDDVKGQSSAG